LEKRYQIKEDNLIDWFKTVYCG